MTFPVIAAKEEAAAQKIAAANVGAVLAKMRPSPYAYLATFDRSEATRRFAGFAHRFHKTRELVALLACIAGAIEKYGSLGALFEECYDPRDADIGPSLARFVTVLRWGAGAPAGANTLMRRRGRRRPTEAPTAAVEYLLSSPEDGSACKRMNLYLRWMVRRTSPDLGLWTFVDPSRLVMPVDTHIHRIATFLGLNDRKSADWKSARAITDRLAVFDRADPVRYDFALCRLGILDLCSRNRRKENCDVCLLRDVCRFPVTKSK